MRADFVRRADSHTFAATRALCLGFLLLAGPCATRTLHAQPATARSQTTSVQKSSSHREPASAKAHRRARTVQEQAEPVTPPAPPKPNWPINSAPAPATITWDSHGLGIKAANSSLQQILEDVGTATGMKVEGTVPDQRVFGAYGPGPARDVLFQLLHGSGYNVLMIGGPGNGVPSRIVLTARSAAMPRSPVSSFAQNGSREEEPPEPEPEPEEPQVQPVPPPNERPGLNPGAPTPPVPPNIQQMRQMQQRMSQPNP